MVFTKVQLWISLIICAVVLVNGSNYQMCKNLDSEQEHELLDLDADIDPDTGVRRYDNYQLFRVTPSTDEHIDILQFLNKGLVQVWSPLSPNVSLVDHADLMVAPKHAGHVKSYLSCSGMGVQVVSDNLQRQIDLENVVKTYHQPDLKLMLVKTFTHLHTPNIITPIVTTGIPPTNLLSTITFIRDLPEHLEIY